MVQNLGGEGEGAIQEVTGVGAGVTGRMLHEETAGGERGQNIEVHDLYRMVMLHRRSLWPKNGVVELDTQR